MHLVAQVVATAGSIQRDGSSWTEQLQSSVRLALPGLEEGKGRSGLPVLLALCSPFPCIAVSPSTLCFGGGGEQPLRRGWQGRFVLFVSETSPSCAGSTAHPSCCWIYELCVCFVIKQLIALEFLISFGGW